MANISVWLAGPFGKMGDTLLHVIEAADDIEITGVISPEHVGQTCTYNSTELIVYGSIEELADRSDKANVVVDFTIADAAYSHAIYCAKNDIDFVTGTTGMTHEQKEEIVTAFGASSAHAIIASNFSVGAVLMMHFSAEAAKHFSHIEILEIHHTQKKDAPSGTALTTQAMMADASQHNTSDIPIHSMRLAGAIAHQQVHLSAPGEILRIEHDANDRACFMPGILLAIRSVRNIDGVLFSIEPLLFNDK
jgi:4-hydroxy-tetrahydrodipicolinate reductase